MGTRKIREYRVFQEAHSPVLEIYRKTSSFPDSERFGLVSQMRRAAVSIPSNIIEGAKRSGTKEFVRFVNIARGSCGELEYQIELSHELGFINETNGRLLEKKCESVGKMLTELHKKLRVADK